MVGFIIIGNKNAITYKEIFPYIKNNELWLGITNPDEYHLPNGEFTQSVKGLCRWYTNLEHNRRNTELDLYKKYSADEYPKYDNYDAIEVSRTENIPMDYEGVMGVPISFLDKYCPTQFEIVGITENAEYLKSLYIQGCEKYDRPYVNGKRMYSRLLIRRKKNEEIVEYGKKFLIIGNMNAITYKEIYPYIKNNELWLGATGIKDMSFKVPSSYGARETRFWIDENGQYWRSLGNGCWYTNIEHSRRNTELDLFKKYNDIEYPKYDNYDAIEVSRVENIPTDYDGVMGVPITFLDKYCPTQFEIVGCVNAPFIGGKGVYKRILIRRR